MNNKIASLILALFCCSWLPSPAESAEAASQFVRFVPGEAQWQGELQTAIISYENEAGVELDLVAAVHIADDAYYAALNRYFSSRDAVLYELVANPEDRPSPRLNSATGRGSALGFVQQALAGFLGVGFQLEHIDYSAANFVHADMTPAQLQETMQAKNENFLSMFLNLALAQLAAEQLAASNGGNSVDNSSGSTLTTLSLMSALLAEDRGTAIKYIVAQELGRSGSTSLTAAMEDQLTILGDRNQIALAVLTESLANPALSHISLFFGAAHMTGIEREVIATLGFRKREQVWMSAWIIP